MADINVNIFREKGTKSFKETEFYDKMGQKNDGKTFFVVSSKLSHFDKNFNLNLNLNHKWVTPTWRKPIWF
jgi:hypothetical protein